MAALKNEKMNKSRTLKTESKTYQVANKNDEGVCPVVC